MVVTRPGVGAGRDTRLRSVGNDEREQTLNQLLTELDGFESGSGEAGPVICIAATNRPDVRTPLHPSLPALAALGNCDGVCF